MKSKASTKVKPSTKERRLGFAGMDTKGNVPASKLPKVTKAEKPTKTRRMPWEPQVGKVTVQLPVAMLETLGAMAKKSGVDISTLVRVSLHNLAKRGSYYDLSTKMLFGKYASETLETVIRCDPGYINWAMKNVDGFEVSEAGLNLLSEIEGRA